MSKIVFTGGSGKAGRHVIPYLLSKGHSILNLDYNGFTKESIELNPALKDVHTLDCDLTDSGQVFNALSSNFQMHNYSNQKADKPDVLIHFAARARVMLVPDNETYRQNTTSTYNVIEAACKLGIQKIIIASSETTYGLCFSQGDHSRYTSVPLEETMDMTPEDPYALSKLSGEIVAKGFARRFGIDIYALRIGNVIEPHEYATDFPNYLDNPEVRFRNAWSYIDARDLGQICDLCIRKSNLGFQIFNATNDTITVRGTTQDVIDKYLTGVKMTRPMGTHEAILSNKKIRDVLGFKDVHDWRKYVQ
ncbi:protein of unknown function [Taphrina deformans PYCC 5710]|uniref:NAD-dependent epimerase/dehydratase domain-containing protein n=1 Tax=Taphrina deformans (strain PYCC 5710 / ATCC 11124 / CBS 356.35 / IMI 108563 / JCM 9778 / NBRC 8474) TaxID=1097556 RepID=R4XDL8_TAPDE|nr:protein of unknown function [Taphrina deformans PYCC 5710]|eukprot:CCG83971.1 protein of unknown function [Taphrina deformans PYCC 5710]